MSMPGGFKAVDSVSEDEVAILDAVKDAVLQGKTPAVFEAVQFTTQVVAGTNYLFKVKVDDEVWHVKVHKPLPHTQKQPELMSFTTGHTLDTPLAP